MRNLIYLIIRFSAIVTFIILECLCFYLIVNYNKSQKEIWAHSSNLFTGAVNKRLNNVYSFFDLQTTNDSLLLENARLLETIINYRISSKDNRFQAFEQSDSLYQYNLIPARVCSKTLHLRDNYISLCKGRNDGIQPGMGVVSEHGVVGIVKSASTKYATVLLLLNSQSRVSGKVKSKEYSGTLLWTSSDPNILNMRNVPKHAEIAIGDTIVTSGYSVAFPPEIPIGKIKNFALEGGGNDYSINVHLDYDLSSIDYVYVVNFEDREEKSELIEELNE
ncbi:MAG: rod shape-determining protein MreC [Saprospiraceae bacterium]|nr:rod shape-determining protein MreC [Saprospiraceae bacterium]